MNFIQGMVARCVLTLAFASFCAGNVFAQNLPTAASIASEMGLGWNLGNAMEATGGPTAWGNPLATQKLIDSVKAAGFKTIRIPAAWDAYSDSTTHVISATWMAQVKAVVDLCVKDSLFVVLNIHWDGGWLENKIDSAVTNATLQAKIKAKQGAYWRQIASTFRNYDRHVLFASTNEPNVKDSITTRAAGMQMLNSFHQIFIDTVRATGGNNASRTLIVQGPNTDILLTNTIMTTLPTDGIANRLMAEVHYYSPYQFCLMNEDATWGKMAYFWGLPNHSTTNTTRNSTWGEESYVDSVFSLMKTQFVDKGIPVLLGEFGTMKRESLTGADLVRHLQSREYYFKTVATSAKAKGIIPVVWDAGVPGNNSMTLFNRTTGAILDLRSVNSLRAAYGMSALPGDTSLTIGAKSAKILYTAKDSLYGQVDLGVSKANISAYDSIIVRAYVNGESSYDSAGTPGYGFLNLSLVTMSKSWTWREASLGTVVFDSWNNYSIPLSTDTTNMSALVPADPTKIDFFALQAYSKGYHGTIYVDYIVFVDNQGTRDTLYTFDFTAPTKFSGDVQSISLIDNNLVAFDVEWKTATTAYSPTTKKAPVFAHQNQLRLSTSNGKIHVNYTATKAGMTQVVLKNIQGQILATRYCQAETGMNSFEIPSNDRGVAIVQVRQGNKMFSGSMVSF